MLDSGGKILYVGDAAGQVKPTTGGGIRYGLSGAFEAARSIVEDFDGSGHLSSYEERWKERWGREIDFQRATRRVFLNMGDRELRNLLEVMKTSNLLPHLMERGDIDVQRTIFRLIIKERRMFRLVVGLFGATLKDFLN